MVLIGFRAVKVASLEHPDLWRSFRSHYEEGKAPRYQQSQHAAMHMAVSFWRSIDAARNLVQALPQLGDYIAEVWLPYGLGINYLDPAQERTPGHMTIWSQAVQLAKCAVSIVSV